MIPFIVRRLLLIPVIIVGVTLITFTLFSQLSPNQQLSTYVQNPATLKQGAETVEKLKEKYGLNDPPVERYLGWMQRTFLQGDMGYSQFANMPVAKAIGAFFPATLELAIFSFVPVIIVGIWLGVLAAVRRGTIIDHFTRVIAILGWAFPSFVLAIFFLLVFYGILEWFPPGRLSTWAELVVNGYAAEFTRYTGLNTIDGILNGRFDIALDALKHLVGPVFTLAFLEWAILLRVMRASMLEILNSDYVRTARSKGLRERVVIKKHARRNALISAITVSGLLVLGFFIGGAIVEVVFNYRGLGFYFVFAAQQLDFAAVMGSALVISGAVVITNLIVDILYGIVDPRIRVS